MRGIDSNWDAATINGVSLSVPEPDSRAMALNLVPTDLLATFTLEVFKTLTLDMYSDSTGRAIEIESLSSHDYDGSHYKFSVENNCCEL
ncbi:hypothetical protein [Microbulbifer epialgicus]|uniref:Uncharacterized protein n=1 Tax=Microbulbifer epialgicus TaxID=393907 RepID=A0ABV4P0J5_9GAMM